jgi:protein-tyrosine phosphatase
VAGGGATRWGAVVRADSPDDLTAAGWAAVEQHGVRTVIDLRNNDERDGAAERQPHGITSIHVAHDAIEERDSGTNGRGARRAPPRSTTGLTWTASRSAAHVLVHCAPDATEPG